MARVDSPLPPPPLAATLNRVVLDAAPVLTASERLHSVYALALEAAAAARGVDLSLADWAAGQPASARLQLTSSTGRHLSTRASGLTGGQASRRPGTR